MNEICINSERLYIITPKIKILGKRLKENNFHEKILIDEHSELIYFPDDWPGDALAIFPSEIERREKNSDILPYWSYIIIDKKRKQVVGGICCKAEPNDKNEIEIGYGINPSIQKKGYATEAVQALTDYLFENTDVASVKAECNIKNIPSIRVLEKSSFKKIGSRFDDEDGNLIVWEKAKNR